MANAWHSLDAQDLAKVIAFVTSGCLLGYIYFELDPCFHGYPNGTNAKQVDLARSRLWALVGQGSQLRAAASPLATNRPCRQDDATTVLKKNVQLDSMTAAFPQRCISTANLKHHASFQS